MSKANDIASMLDTATTITADMTIQKDAGYLTFIPDTADLVGLIGLVFKDAAGTTRWAAGYQESTDKYFLWDETTSSAVLNISQGSSSLAINGKLMQFDDIVIGEWEGSADFSGLVHSGSETNGYMIISNGSDHTYISTPSSDGDVILRPGVNSSNHELRVTIPGVTITGGFPVNSSMNMAPQYGGLCTGVPFGDTDGTTTFDKTDIFEPYNSATVVDGGKYTNNSTTYGGSQAAVPTTVQNLLTAMGRTGGNARYGREFHIARITAGSGTLVPYSSHYLMTYNPESVYFGHSNAVTFMFWARASSGTPIVRGSGAYKAYAGGQTGTEFSGSSYALTSTWTHIAIYISNSSTGYNNTAFNLYGTVGDIVEVALPLIMIGDVYPATHRFPAIGPRY